MTPKERELAHVPRWVIVRTIRNQSVAEHAFFMTRYAIDIASTMGLDIRAEFIDYCLRHDDDELHTGDIPAPYKKILDWHNKKPELLWEMTGEEWMVLKAADLLEGILFLIDEELMGNKTVGMVCNSLCEELEYLTRKYNTTGGEVLSSWLWKRIDTHRTYRGRLK